MHICYISREYPPSMRGGGIASYIKEVAEGMAQRGHTVTVICASDDTRESSDETQGNLRIIRLSGGDFLIPQAEPSSFLKKFRFIFRYRSYRKRVRKCVESLKNADVIEVPEYGSESLFLDNIGIPVVVRLHTPCLLNHYTFGKVKLNKRNFPYYVQVRHELKVMSNAQYSTSCSTSLKEWGIRYANMERNRVRVIYNPINLTKWEIPESVMLPKNEVTTILFAGTICDWKGCEDLAEAGRILEKKLGRKFKISFVGKAGSWAQQLRDKFGQYEWFDFVGKVPREDLMKRYATADVVIFPSWWENMPMVCIEAMLQGALVIGSTSGGMSEIIEDTQSGYLVEPRSPEKIASKIIEVLSLSDNVNLSVRKNAIERIKKYFSTETILKEMEDYFFQIIDDKEKNK